MIEVRGQSDDNGRVHLYRDGALQPTPFLELGPLATFFSTGLLCMAFDPDHAANGFVYVKHVEPNLDVRVSRFTRDASNPDVLDPASVHPVITIPQPTNAHNGGWIGFGPDGLLYISSGDGGDQEDPDQRGQDLQSLLGKMLRIDVRNDGFPADPERNYSIPSDNPFVDEAALDEIWAYGLREPWRCTFDSATGDLYITDVGQAAWEEVNRQNASSLGGENFGWRCVEGPDFFMADPECVGATFVAPLHAYPHADGNCSVTGGVVYRGREVPGLTGRYLFADWCTSRVWSFNVADPSDVLEHTLVVPDGITLGRINSIDADACGEVYVSARFNQVFRLGPGPTLDCNANGVDDACEISLGTASDDNVSGIPDACESLCDIDGATGITIGDMLSYLEAWFAGDASAERTGDDEIGVGDLLAFLACWFDSV